jgi:demethylmenaquinone methyltransferase/2-methoxy-6-polyprenyl-1,4-benzoquinol methylase
VTRAHLDKDPHDVAAMFDEVAPKYDRTNTVLSMGQDRRWRKAVAAGLDLKPGQRVLDLAAGTATSAAALARSGATVVGCDFSLGMLREGRGKGVDLVAGDALRLPFADAVFDAVTISFGLRNVNDTHQALSELRRVTRPGGRLVVCEFSHPTWKPFRTVYSEYLMRLLPAVATKVSSDPAAYVYLAESIRAWPDQAALARQVEAAGWERVGWRDLSGGIVALHRAVRPA